MSPPKGHSERALTLIELIGVLAVMAILAAVLLPSFVRQMDKIVGDQEIAALKSLDGALRGSILRTRSIPSDAGWAAAIAAELGVNSTDITANARKKARVYLIDPALSLGGALPYSQSGVGLANPPVSPRVIILSSIGASLPAGLVSGVPSAANFTNIWDAADGTVSAAPVFSGWAGTGDDLKVQRVNLSGLFVSLTLTTSPVGSTTLGKYSINSIATNDVATGAGIGTRYFIQNSVLGLHTHTNSLDSQQILIRDSSFVYDYGSWRSSLGYGGNPGGLDLAAVVSKFLGAPPNTVSGASTQLQVVQAMKTYMDAYEAWARGADGIAGTGDDFPSGNTGLRGDAMTKQSLMMTAVQNLYTGAYYPNVVACP